MTHPTHAQEPQCPPVPDHLLVYLQQKFHTTQDCAQEGANWGYTQGLAAAQRLAAEERQRGADEELEACCAFLAKNCPNNIWGVDGMLRELRAARRPKPPTLREQAIEALREHLIYPMRAQSQTPRAVMQLALQALEEAGDE